MISWYFRRFRPVRRSQVSILSSRIDALEDRVTPTANFTGSPAFANSVPSPNALNWSIQTGDFNGDGIDDFITDNGFGTNKIGVYQGNGDKTFTLKATVDVAAAPFSGTVQVNSVVFRDFASPGGGAPDGLDDIAFIDSAFNEVVVLPSDGTGKFTTTGFISTATTFQRISMTAGDFNNDGMNDLFVGRFGGGGPDGTAGEYDVLLNNGDGTFKTLPRSQTNGLDNIALQPIARDLNNDGFIDAVAVNQFPVSGTGRGGVYFGAGDGTFNSGATLNVPVNKGISKFAVGDFDGNGLQDVVLFVNDTATTSSTGYAFYQTSKGVFPTNPQKSFTTSFQIQDVRAADFDLDGIADLALTPFSAIETTFRVFIAGPGQAFPSGDGQSFTTEGVNSPIAIIDGNNNGIPDLLVGTRTDTGSIAKFQYFDNDNLPTGPVSSTVSIAATPNPVTFGNTVTFTATVDQFGAVPTGLVTFSANGMDIGSSMLAGGKATFMSSGPFPVGTLTFSASYEGDANYFSGTSPIRSITVDPLASNVGLTYETGFADAMNGDAQTIFGGKTTYTATIAPVGANDPTGTFTFFANTTLLGTAKVDATGMATLVSPLASAGANETLTAVYGGDPIYSVATATAAQLLDVFTLPTATQIVSPANPAVFGQPLTYTVTVFPDPNQIPGFFLPLLDPFYSGAVVIFDNDNVIASLNLDPTGKAVYVLPADYALGNHTIRAVFTGTANIDPSSSPSFVQVINKAASQVDLTADSAAITFGDNVVLNAAVSIVAPGVGFPNGTVTLFQDGVQIDQAFVGFDGNTSFTVSGLAAGSYNFTANFSGNDQVAGATSMVLPVTVAATTSTTTLTVAPEVSSLGTPIFLTAAVVDADGLPVTVGSITFSGVFNDLPIDPVIVPVSNGMASTVLNGLPFGSGTIAAAYTGTVSIGDSVATPVDFSITKANPALFLTTTSVASVPFGTAIPFTATLVPPSGVLLPTTGTIDFFDNGELFDSVTVSGNVATTSRVPSLGGHSITAIYNGDANYTEADSNPVGLSIFRPTDNFAVGAGSGGPDRVNVYDANGKKVFSPLFAFSPDHTSGVRVAMADFNGDGVPDIVLGTGPGTASRVRILSGVDGAPLADFSPFGEAFTGGVYVAAGDINGDFRADLVVTPDRSGGARVRVFDNDVLTIDNSNPTSRADFIAIIDGNGRPDTNFRGGARGSIGDINGDGFGDVVVAAGVGGGPRIATFSGQTLGLTGGPKLFGDFLAFEATLRNGAFVAVGDVNGDGLADIVAGAGPGGGPRVSIFAGSELLAGREARVSDFFAGDVNSRGGVPIAVHYLDGDEQIDLIVGTGGSDDHVTAYLGASIFGVSTAPTPFLSFDAFANSPDPADATRGVFVG